MLLSENVRTVVTVGALAVAFVAPLVLVLRCRPLSQSGSLPAAHIEADRRRISVPKARAIAVALFFAGLAAAYWSSTHTIEVIAIEDGQVRGERIVRKGVYARSLADIPRAPDELGSTDTWLGLACWVVNRSSAPVLLYKIDIDSRGQRRTKETVRIPAGTRSGACPPDWIGPSNEPPDTPNLRADWLTWEN